jgi:hypothetical protein
VLQGVAEDVVDPKGSVGLKSLDPASAVKANPAVLKFFNIQ